MSLKRRKTTEAIKPQMTSLVDVLTVLVFFLLKNFSTEGDILTPSKNLELPVSTAIARPEKVLTISISRENILADGQAIASVGEEAARKDINIPALAEWLIEQRKNTEEIAQYDANVSFKGDLVIQGDKQIPYWLLQKVLHTCGENGYGSFSLAVLQKNDG